MEEGQIQLLSAEIDKLIQAPYAVSLKGLLNVLTKCHFNDLADWADLHPHKIQQLAFVVTESLSIWPQTLEVIQRLSSVVEIRDWILHESPLLLNHLLDLATKNDDDNERYTKIAVALMSEPLPDGMALPATAIMFLSQCFVRAVKDLTVETARPVHSLLRGGCYELLDVLPQDQLNQFGDHLARMLRTVKIMEEQTLNLLCLAIMAKIQRPSLQQPQVDTSPGGTVVRIHSTDAVPAKSGDAVAKLFFGEKAPRTLHLVVLQVIYACGKHDNHSTNLGMAQIGLAREVLEAFDPDVKENWVKANAALVRKLHEKLAQEELVSHLRLEAFSFAVILSDVSKIPPIILGQLKDILLSFPAPMRCGRALRKTLGITVPQLLAYFDTQFWHDMMVGMARNIHDTQNATKRTARCNIDLLHAIRDNFGGHASAFGRLMQAVNSIRTPQILNTFSTSAEATNLSTSHHGLHSGICHFILEAAFNAPADTVPLSVPTAAFLLSQIQQPPSKSLPRLSRPTTEGLISGERLQARGASVNWRQNLALDFEMDAKVRSQAMSRTVGQICQDLEQRCETIEEPLRLEQSKWDALSNEFDALRKKHTEAERWIDERQYQVNELQNEKSRLEAEVMQASEKAEELAEQLHSVEDSLELAVADAARVLAATRHEFDHQKMELRTTIACHAETVEDQQAEIETLKEQMHVTEQTSKEQVDKMQQQIEVLEKSMSHLEQHLVLEKQEVSTKNHAINQLEIQHSSLAEETRRLIAQLDEAQAHNAQLTTSHASAEKAWLTKAQTLQAQHDSRLADLTAEWTSTRQMLETYGATKDKELGELRDTFTKERDSKERQYQELYAVAQRYLKDIKAKAAQIEQLMEWKSNLMLAMGMRNAEQQQAAPLALQQAVAASSDPHQHTQQPKPRAHQSRQSRRPSALNPVMDMNLDGAPAPSTQEELDTTHHDNFSVDDDLEIPSPAPSPSSQTSPTPTPQPNSPPPPPASTLAPLSPPTKRTNTSTRPATHIKAFRVPTITRHPLAVVEASIPPHVVNKPLRTRHSVAGGMGSPSRREREREREREPLTEACTNTRLPSPIRNPRNHETKHLHTSRRKTDFHPHPALSKSKSAAAFFPPSIEPPHLSPSASSIPSRSNLEPHKPGIGPGARLALPPTPMLGGSSWKQMFAAAGESDVFGQYEIGTAERNIAQENVTVTGLSLDVGGGGGGGGGFRVGDFDGGSTTVEF